MRSSINHKFQTLDIDENNAVFITDSTFRHDYFKDDNSPTHTPIHPSTNHPIHPYMYCETRSPMECYIVHRATIMPHKTNSQQTFASFIIFELPNAVFIRKLRAVQSVGPSIHRRLAFITCLLAQFTTWRYWFMKASTQGKVDRTDKEVQVRTALCLQIKKQSQQHNTEGTVTPHSIRTDFTHISLYFYKRGNK